jgi:protein gp37
MAERSNIEWCDATFNPWIGCTKVSPACDHCYAERDFDLRLHVVQWGAGQARKRTGDDNWKKPGKWNAKPFYECEVCGLRTDNPMRAQCKGPHRSQHMWKPARRRVFCASLADVFDNEVPAEWRAELFALIAATPNLDWLLLTKRIGNVAPMIAAPGMQKCGLPPNVWLGATICNQSEADRDIPKLLAVPAAVRFVSIEPMLGPVDLTDIVVRHGGGTEDHFSALYDADDDEADTASYIDWVICGGESGPHARPMHPDWARSLRDQCAAAGVPFFMKQMTKKAEIPDDLLVRRFPYANA